MAVPDQGFFDSNAKLFALIIMATSDTSGQPSGFYLAIWRMRPPLLTPILFSHSGIRKGVAKRDQFNVGNNFKRICVCGGKGGR
jgi:hypothetical protein